ncbi:MAG TPA: hypothetical protein VF997_10840 [Polyangia bacterium]
MSAAFVKNGRALFLDSRVGALKPEVYRLDAPNDPPNEMDYRFVDQEGRTFFANRGGDNWIDPTWDAEIRASQHAIVDLAQREIDFKVAREAAAAFTNVAPAAFVNHTFHMANFALQAAPSEDPRMIAAAAEIAKTPPPTTLPNGESAYGSYNSGGWSTFFTAKYSGSTGCFAWVCAASHSATLIWSCDWNGSGCSWKTVISANNHGRDYSQLGFDCSTQGGWQYNGIDGSTAGSSTGWWDGQGGCQTAYSWSSSSNAHLCNDDAAYELWEAKYGPQDNVGFSVYDGSWCRGSACGSSPSTFSCNYPNGDWNTPNCP